jgi:hypothetical protein
MRRASGHKNKGPGVYPASTMIIETRQRFANDLQESETDNGD